jgi:hypothetical protein
VKLNVITLVGLVLIVVGALAFAIGGIQYGAEAPGADVEPVEAPAQDAPLPLTPLFGGIALVAGIVFVVIGVRGPPDRRRGPGR